MNRKINFIGIDGTGPDSDSEYRKAFANSFVMRLATHVRTDPMDKYYRRGPNQMDTGFNTSDVARYVADMIWNRRHELVNYRLVLAGYSRGAAAVVDAAASLKKRGATPHASHVYVDTMVLFDAVNTFSGAKGAIPSNVRKVFHLQRMPSGNSRPDFESCATSAPAPVRYSSALFGATHGGLGGVPWPLPLGAQLTDRIIEPGLDTNYKMMVTGGATAVGAVFTPLVGGYVGFKVMTKVSDHKTNVTYAQDLAGSGVAWHWISGKLKEEGIL